MTQPCTCEEMLAAFRDALARLRRVRELVGDLGWLCRNEATYQATHIALEAAEKALARPGGPPVEARSNMQKVHNAPTEARDA